MESNKKSNFDIHDFFLKIAQIADPDHSFISIGPKLIPLNILVNIQKAGTIIVMFSLMCYFNNFSLGSWIYLSLHGTYGIIWILKDLIFPDKTFQQKVTIPVAFLTGFVLLLYWGIGLIMISGYGDQNPSPFKLFLCYFIFTIGLFLMICTDLQKNITLKMKSGLIDNYFLAKNRNTNYLGEMLIYFSFVYLTNNLFAYLLVIFVWISLFSCRIYLKEVSLIKKDGFVKYKKNSYLLLFKFCDSDTLNFLLYTFISIIILIFCYIGNHK